MTAQAELRSMRWSAVSGQRVIVMLTALCWLVLVSPFPSSLHGTGILVLLALVGLDVALGATTDWLAFAPTSRLDERQAAIRDGAYRVAFRLIAIGVLVMVVLSVVGSQSGSDPSGTDVPGGLIARHLLALLELLVIAPSAVIGWLAVTAEERPTERHRRAPFLAVPAIGIAWLIATPVLPVGTSTAIGMSGAFGLSGASCQHYAAEKAVAAGFGGTVRLRAEVCWDGRHAFAFGDPSLHTPMDVVPSPVPASELASPMSMPSLPDLTSCAPRDPDSDFVNVSQWCSEQIGPDGTMRLTVHGTISALPGGVGTRDVQIQLVVDANGKLLAEG